MYDIVIIGLGPAGATLARLLDKKYKVAVIDKKDVSGKEGFQKPCGGLLAPDAQKSLSQFNLTLPKDILVDPQVFTVKTVDTKQNLSRYYQRFYLNMDRHRFDLWLISLLPENVDIFDTARCTDIRRENGGYSVKYVRNDETYTVKSKYVIGADGANSFVRRKLFPNVKIMQYISIQQWFEDKNVRPLYSCFFDSDITDCYAWSLSKDGFFIVGGAFPLKESRSRFEALKQRLEARGYMLGKPVKTEACMVLRPANILEFCTGRNGAFLIGEAAGFISPSSLEGISYSFESAKRLSKVLNGDFANPNFAYDKSTFFIKLKLFAKMLKSLFMYVPLLRRFVMKSGLSSIEVIEAQCVRF